MTTTIGSRPDLRESGVREAVSAASAAVIAALAIATCSAAPEFIWQGLKIVATHLTSATLVSAILVALLLVFFVEPILERLRGWLSNAPETAEGARHHLAIAAAIGFFIALVSVGLHDAMSTFAAGEGEAHNVGLERAVTVAVSWGAVRGRFFHANGWSWYNRLDADGAPVEEPSNARLLYHVMTAGGAGSSGRPAFASGTFTKMKPRPASTINPGI